MSNLLATLIFLILIIIGIVFLQIFLSKKESKWLGLILPFLTFCFSLVAVAGIAVFTTGASATMQEQILQNGEIIYETQEIATTAVGTADVTSAIATAIYAFLTYNIPTAILLAIYFACREKQKRNRDLEKMNIQDLQ